MNIFQQLLIEEEDRKRREDLEYKELTKGKGDAKIVDRVIVALKGAEGGAWTRNLNRWNRFKVAIERMEKKKAELEKKFKNEAIQFFALEDEVITRVVETGNFSILLKKQTVPDDKVSVDYEGIVKELTAMMPEIEDKIKEVTATYTRIIKGEKPALPAMSITPPKLEEGVSDIWKEIKAVFKDLLKKFKTWGKTYDKKLNALKKKAKL